MRRTLLVITALLLAVLAPTKASASPASAAAPVGLDPGSLTVVPVGRGGAYVDGAVTGGRIDIDPSAPTGSPVVLGTSTVGDTAVTATVQRTGSGASFYVGQLRVEGPSTDLTVLVFARTILDDDGGASGTSLAFDHLTRRVKVVRWHIPVPPVLVSASGNAFAFAPPGFPGWGRIEGGTVHVLEHPELSTTTGASGFFQIDGIPAGSEATFVLEADGFPRTQTKTFTVPETGLERVTFQVPNDQLYGGLALIAGIELDPTKCQMVSTVTVAGKSLYDPGAHGEAGAVVVSDPPLPGPIYFNESVLPDPSRTESSADGGIVFVNVDPGVYTLTAIKPGVEILPVKMTCTPNTMVNAAPPYGLQVVAP